MFTSSKIAYRNGVGRFRSSSINACLFTFFNLYCGRLAVDFKDGIDTDAGKPPSDNWAESLTEQLNSNSNNATDLFMNMVKVTKSIQAMLQIMPCKVIQANENAGNYMQKGECRLFLIV